ncbi:MAG: hypothetical protein IPK26_08570 [Planctomycetes bacterium]|nr:hypothetical protein [Planctomycetota bacterium]
MVVELISASGREPVSGLGVELSSLSAETRDTRHARTDVKGHAVFEAVPPGSYSIGHGSGVHVQLANSPKSVTVSPRTESRVTLELFEVLVAGVTFNGVQPYSVRVEWEGSALVMSLSAFDQGQLHAVVSEITRRFGPHAVPCFPADGRRRHGTIGAFFEREGLHEFPVALASLDDFGLTTIDSSALPVHPDSAAGRCLVRVTMPSGGMAELGRVVLCRKAKRKGLQSVSATIGAECLVPPGDYEMDPAGLPFPYSLTTDRRGSRKVRLSIQPGRLSKVGLTTDVEMAPCQVGIGGTTPRLVIFGVDNPRGETVWGNYVRLEPGKEVVVWLPVGAAWVAPWSTVPDVRRKAAVNVCGGGVIVDVQSLWKS